MTAPYLQLEKEYAEYIGTTGCVTVNTGTAALHVALEALQLEPGDEIIVPEFTMIASAWAVKYAGLKPVFVDCRRDLLIDTNKIEEKITPRTKAIMVTHIYGRVCDMKRVALIAEKYGLRVIEDACEAQGAKYDHLDAMVGSYDIGCFSFYRNKIICGEEGGAITSNDDEFLARCVDLKNMAFGDEHNYLHGKIGFNYRMTDSQAKMILESLHNVESNLASRRRVERWYNKYLPSEIQTYIPRQVVWVYDIRLKPDQDKDNFVAWLNEECGIAARHSFKPMSMQPAFNYNYKHLSAFRVSEEVCYLPVNPDMTEQEVIEICERVKEILE